VEPAEREHPQHPHLVLPPVKGKTRFAKNAQPQDRENLKIGKSVLTSSEYRQFQHARAFT